MFAHPYDWRLPPGRLEERDASFTRLKQKIEAFVANFRKRYPQSPVRGVLLVGLSLGNLFIQYFFLYLQKELGEHGLNRWADQHIHGKLLAQDVTKQNSNTSSSVFHWFVKRVDFRRSTLVGIRWSSISLAIW